MAPVPVHSPNEMATMAMPGPAFVPSSIATAVAETAPAAIDRSVRAIGIDGPLDALPGSDTASDPAIAAAASQR